MNPSSARNAHVYMYVCTCMGVDVDIDMAMAICAYNYVYACAYVMCIYAYVDFNVRMPLALKSEICGTRRVVGLSMPPKLWLLQARSLPCVTS